MVSGCRTILQGFQRSFSVSPTILLENRTGQFISTGTDINNFWKALEDTDSETVAYMGIVLDVQQLYTSTQQRFMEELSTMPPESIKALHIHTKHRMPTLDKIPWWQVIFNWVQTLAQPLLINPEIYHRNHIPEAIDFCKQQMEKGAL